MNQFQSQRTFEVGWRSGWRLILKALVPVVGGAVLCLMSCPVLAQHQAKEGWYGSEAGGARPPIVFQLSKRGNVFQVTGTLGKEGPTSGKTSLRGTYYPATKRLAGTWELKMGKKKQKFPIDGTYDPAHDEFDLSVGVDTMMGIKKMPYHCARTEAPEENQASSWAGAWSTNWGTMKLNQSGSKVTGSYVHDKGKITGDAANGILKGRWSEAPSYSGSNDSGDFEFTMSQDGRAFKGKWRYGNAGDWHNDWTGTR